MVALKAGTTIEWDPVAMKAKNVPSADQYIRRDYRKGFLDPLSGRDVSKAVRTRRYPRRTTDAGTIRLSRIGRRTRSISVGRDDLAAANRSQGAARSAQLIEFLTESDAAIGEEGVDAAGMVAPGRDGGVGRPAVVLVFGAHVAVEAGGPAGTWCWGQGRSQAVIEGVAVAPMGMPAAGNARRELASRGRGRRDARKDGGKVRIRQRAGRSGRRNRATVVIRRRIRFHLRGEQRITEPIGERREPRLIGTEGTRIRQPP